MTENARVRSIPTPYNGYRFRSRLEARWAVFLDTLGVPYVFEPEGYELGGEDAASRLRYLPDFWLPALDAFLEIKPTVPDGGESTKAAELARATGKRVFVFWGPPTVPDGELSDGIRLNPTWGSQVHAPEGGWVDGDWWWCECPVRSFTQWAGKQQGCGTIGIEYCGKAYRLPCEHADADRRERWPQYASPRITAAVATARSYRFKGIW